ncbi:MAG: hypothetical protein KBC17_03020 [Candidatus Pacebacteria bacterium]|nr:hypothetical protein [Candidatus Paceibacterota bacterium]
MKENKKSLIIGGVVGLCLIVAIVIMFSVRKNDEVVPEIVSENSTETEGNTSNTVTPVTPIPPTKEPVVKAPYAVALAEYSKYGRRIQFDEKCQAVPFMSTFKNGTTIMIDNRSSKSHDIRIGSKTYKVSAYSYELAKLSITNSPTTYTVDCDSQQNPATIIVQ